MYNGGLKDPLVTLSSEGKWKWNRVLSGLEFWIRDQADDVIKSRQF